MRSSLTACVPGARLSRTVPVSVSVSWETSAMWERSSLTGIEETFLPPTKISPRSAS